MSALADAFMEWDLSRGEEKKMGDSDEMIDGSISIKVVDLYYEFVTVALVHQGFLPCAPFQPSVVITVSAMECPQFTIQPFIKMLCDLHAVAFQPYLLQQFSICYDFHVHTALGHDTPNCCTYKLEGEKPLRFAMLGTMDGNDSLKHVEKWESDYFIPRDKVDQCSKEAIGESLVHSRDGNDESPCSERWQNMINDMSAKTWGIFDETRIFVCLYMVRSGELGKYPLAITEQLLDLYGDDLGIGYDAGCKFGTTHAHALRFSLLVGLFHGHAHQCLCQILFLTTYILGLGLEDLEGCEHFFSGSNALAAAIRHASRFHQHQAITTYMKYKDRFHTFQNLSSFLCNNYRQALDILWERLILEDSMKQLEIQDESVFDSWLKEEEEYLAKLFKEPPQETLEMEYFTALLDMYTLQASVDEAADTWTMVTVDMVNKQTHRTETAHQHLLEKCNNALKTMQQWEIGSIDNLECLVVSHIFELTKMRKHIWKALQTCSQAIRTALDRYNNAAHALGPPCAILRWDQIKRAEEEIDRLNIEIPCLLTYMADEDRYLQDQNLCLQASNPALAHQISRYHLERVHFYDQHHKCFAHLSKQPAGTVVGTRPGWNGSAVAEVVMCRPGLGSKPWLGLSFH
ncbi:hypothetical protein ARMGADRAFT_1142864 [Armillaria gallica]|uniref:CxC2-like cysteine cluster KDZ transposase-associated domain-containing protein n=1 Tax=Armillaria gallica TaxID=47427 RepID=A0A2H3DLP3_ARMGA|nr:hypothetical protein ARMGADRAFT_1142864 [Armillaria gallica]